MQPFNVCWSLTTWMVQLALIVLTVHAQNCIKPIGGPNMVLSDAFITQETFVDGAKVTFQCAIGYSSVGGSRSVTCTAGVWSDVKLKCERKSCGSPGEVINGRFDISEGILFGDKVVATCDIGYMLVGSSGMTCMDGGWYGRVPVCEVVKCGKPPTIVNGGPVVPPEDTYNYGSVVQYDCKMDYTLVGSKSITCSENGEFQPAPPECKMVSCPLPVVENGVRIDGCPPYTYKSSVTYKCNAGYEMEGQASLTCEMEGWSAPYPTCKVVSCPPPVVENGVRIDGCPPYTYKSSVTYKCNAGYEMEGQASLTCEMEGWSAPYPTCKALLNTTKPPTTTTTTTTKRTIVHVVSCPPPVVENGVRIDGCPPYTYKSSVTYKCNAGYEMEGQASLTCEMEGWSAPYPTCKDEAPDEERDFARSIIPVLKRQPQLKKAAVKVQILQLLYDAEFN